MSIKELCRYLTHYQHLHDYVWYMLRESGYQHGEPFHCSPIFSDAKRFHNIVSGHFSFLSDTVCSDKEFVGFSERMYFLRSLAMCGNPENTLSHIYLVVNLAKKMMSDGREDLVNTLIKDSYPRLFSAR